MEILLTGLVISVVLIGIPWLGNLLVWKDHEALGFALLYIWAGIMTAICLVCFFSPLWLKIVSGNQMTLPEFPPDRAVTERWYKSAGKRLDADAQQKQVAVAVRFALADLLYELSEPNPVPNQAQDASNN